jgi:2,4-dienoyl-CoA reductase-like NADH-dependent reductase (Old Yellow Enzyme family)
LHNEIKSSFLWSPLPLAAFYNSKTYYIIKTAILNLKKIIKKRPLNMSLFIKNNDLPFEMKNRFVRSATHEALATKDGRPTEELSKLYEKLAKGGVGAIITGFAAAQPNGKSPGDNMLMIDRDELIEEYKPITEMLKSYNCRSIMQIAHCGAQTTAADVGGQKVAPSAVMHSIFRDEKPHALTEVEIEELIGDFVAAIRRAQKAGFDAAQIHGAHGYLLCSFLSPGRNKRKDKWGGSLENRFRVIREIVTRAKKEMPDFPLFIKLSAFDHQKVGITLEETVTVCKWLEEIGIDAIEVSSGVSEDGMATIRCAKKPVDALMHYFPPLKAIKSGFVKLLVKLVLNMTMKNRTPLHNYNRDAAIAIKAKVSVPLMLVGGIRTLADMEDIIDSGDADFISMSRPLILEPSLINHLEQKKQDNSRCIDCGYCIAGVADGAVRCYYGKLN